MALFGKLPAHGDFIRRGDPKLVKQVDDWLTEEVDRRAAIDGDALDVRLAALPTWCFLLPGGTSGALAASADRVGRVFPVIACASGGRRTAEGVAGLLVRAIEDVEDADVVSAALVQASAAQFDEHAEAETDEQCADAATWWRPFGDVPATFAVAGLPIDADFAQLLIADV